MIRLLGSRRCSLTAVLILACSAMGGTSRHVANSGVDRASDPARADSAALIVPTQHAPVPATPAEAWLVPGAEVAPTEGERAFAAGVTRLAGGDPTGAVPLLSDKRIAGSPVSGWATYFLGQALLAAGRPAEAMRAFEEAMTSIPESVVVERAMRALADAAESAGDLPRSLALFTTLAERATASPDEVLKRLAEVASKAGEGGRARTAWLKLYYEHPLSAYAPLAEPIAAEARAAAGASVDEIVARDAERAEQLFNARRFADARAAFARLLPQAAGDTREMADLRIAECDYSLLRHRAALDRLEPWLERASRRAEARYFHLLALRALGSHDEYVTRVRALVSDFPDTSWAEDALNHLGTHYILVNDDAASAAAFKELFEKYPSSRHAERAAWKAGWWQYKVGDYASAAATFERAAALWPRADQRPAWLYWAGRAREALDQRGDAQARYDVVLADYRHSYYGRLAGDRLSTATTHAQQRRAKGADAGVVRASRVERASDAAREPREAFLADDPPNREVIRRLMALERWDEAIAELQFAQRAWGSRPRLEATLAWIYNRQGDLRRAITVMKRAYPQYLAEAGEQLPRAVLEVIFPLAYWDVIRKYASARRIDPHVVAALIAQESTFQPDARSSANALGLMQIIPSTGRKLARTEKITRFTANQLKQPETNIRLGTRYFASLVERFGGAHFALASYNAGESRVVRWRAERPGLAAEEFVDDIPFPETQNYVKKILGTAQDYRWLYPLSAPASPAPRGGTGSRRD